MTDWSCVANVKQVLTIVLAVVIFNLKISPTNALGILLTLFGGGLYGAIEYGEKRSRGNFLLLGQREKDRLILTA